MGLDLIGDAFCLFPCAFRLSGGFRRRGGGSRRFGLRLGACGYGGISGGQVYLIRGFQGGAGHRDHSASDYGAGEDGSDNDISVCHSGFSSFCGMFALRFSLAENRG